MVAQRQRKRLDAGVDLDRLSLSQFAMAHSENPVKRENIVRLRPSLCRPPSRQTQPQWTRRLLLNCCRQAGRSYFGIAMIKGWSLNVNESDLTPEWTWTGSVPTVGS